ncbi:interleukin-5 [Pteronotus mesoamericanus]|uniref:interleukin-5 n=1 Tax=Pteronotus mesoamericanus TaxID=1884717 RepID=UPI0023EC357A|nr:interleukin-5 [Pteronotus parnellii mesoamericanus]
MRMLLHLSLLALGAASTWAMAEKSPMAKLVAETMALLSTHQAVLIGDGNLMIPTPGHEDHQLCIEEVFQGIEILKNETAQGHAVEKLFQNLSSIKEYIDHQRKNKCEGERWRVKKFLEYLHRFLAVMNTEWTSGK